jgi:integrase
MEAVSVENRLKVGMTDNPVACDPDGRRERIELVAQARGRQAARCGAAHARGDRRRAHLSFTTSEGRAAFAALARDVVKEAEVAGGISRVRARGPHALRRMFANELRDIPLRDLADLGGWKSSQTIVEAYQRRDVDAQRAALDERHPRRRRA